MHFLKKGFTSKTACNISPFLKMNQIYDFSPDFSKKYVFGINVFRLFIQSNVHVFGMPGTSRENMQIPHFFHLRLKPRLANCESDMFPTTSLRCCSHHPLMLKVASFVTGIRETSAPYVGPTDLSTLPNLL